MDSLLEYLRGITGVDFLKYPERDMWPICSSPEYRERIIEYVTTDPRASKRDYFSILLEGTLPNIYHAIRLRFWRRQDEQPSGQRFTTYKARHLETISTSVAVALSSLLPGTAMLVLFYVKDIVLRIVLVLVFTTMSPPFSRSSQTRERSRFTRPQQRMLVAHILISHCSQVKFAAVVIVFIGSDALNNK